MKSPRKEVSEIFANGPEDALYTTFDLKKQNGAENDFTGALDKIEQAADLFKHRHISQVCVFMY